MCKKDGTKWEHFACLCFSSSSNLITRIGEIFFNSFNYRKLTRRENISNKVYDRVSRVKIFSTTLYMNSNRWVNTGEILFARNVKLTWLQPINRHRFKQTREKLFSIRVSWYRVGYFLVDERRMDLKGERGGGRGEEAGGKGGGGGRAKKAKRIRPNSAIRFSLREERIPLGRAFCIVGRGLY